jgi:hypothetical protein
LLLLLQCERDHQYKTNKLDLILISPYSHKIGLYFPDFSLMSLAFSSCCLRAMISLKDFYKTKD